MKHALLLIAVLLVSGCDHFGPQGRSDRASGDGSITLTEERIGSPVVHRGAEP